MTSFKRLIIDWLTSEPDRVESYHNTKVSATLNGSPGIESEKGIHFTLYKASGGMVVETRTYDHNKDRTNRGLYIVRDDQELGSEISKILTMENLR